MRFFNLIAAFAAILFAAPQIQGKYLPTDKWTQGPEDVEVPGHKSSYNNRDEQPKVLNVCTVHVIQIWTDDRVEIRAIMINSGGNIMGTGDSIFEYDHKPLKISSYLDNTLNILPGGWPKDPVFFEIGDQKWHSKDTSHCTVGKYDHGEKAAVFMLLPRKREMDCKFMCDP